MNKTIQYVVNVFETKDYGLITNLFLELEYLPEEGKMEICEWLIANRPDIWEYFCEMDY